MMPNFRLLLMHSDVISSLNLIHFQIKVDKHQVYQYYTFVQFHVIIIMIFSQSKNIVDSCYHIFCSYQSPTAHAVSNLISLNQLTCLFKMMCGLSQHCDLIIHVWPKKNLSRYLCVIHCMFLYIVQSVKTCALTIISM